MVTNECTVPSYRRNGHGNGPPVALPFFVRVVTVTMKLVAFKNRDKTGKILIFSPELLRRL
jgi:hypothetical protein